MEELIKFKLCHKYCEKCYEYGYTNDNQTCVSCLSSYTYDYLAAVNNFTGNCVPYGNMYDAEENKLIECDSVEVYKYYYNL